MLFRKLFPQKALFFDLFDQHVALTSEAAKKLSLCISSNFDLAPIANIKILEHNADIITRKCLEALQTTFITPFDRDQIYQLISRLDDIMDCIDDTADCIMIYKLHTATPDLIELARLLTDSIQQIALGVHGLRDLHAAITIRQACKEIVSLERTADIILHSAIGRLFDEELDARELIKWKEIYQFIESGTDRCADVADVMEGILLEND